MIIYQGNYNFHFQGQEICRVFCGAQFSLALSKSGALFTWGKGDNHRLGHNSEEHVRYPKQVKGLTGEVLLYFPGKGYRDTGPLFIHLGYKKVMQN